MFKAYSCKIWGKRENLKVQMVFLSVKWFATNHALGSLSCKESVFSGGNSSLSGLQIYSSNRLLSWSIGIIWYLCYLRGAFLVGALGITSLVVFSTGKNRGGLLDWISLHLLSLNSVLVDLWRQMLLYSCYYNNNNINNFIKLSRYSALKG